MFGRFPRLVGSLNFPLPPPMLCVVKVGMPVSLEVIKRLPRAPMRDSMGELREADIQVLFVMMSLWFCASKRQLVSRSGLLQFEAE